jgi:hypothetical protein
MLFLLFHLLVVVVKNLCGHAALPCHDSPFLLLQQEVAAKIEILLLPWALSVNFIVDPSNYVLRPS